MKTKRIITELYSSTSNVGRNVGETNDCTVVSTSIVTGVDYLTAHAALEQAGRKCKSGAHIYQQLKALQQLGFVAENQSARNFIAQFPGNHKSLRNLTTHHPARFAKHWPKGSFLLFTRHHVAACVDGVVHDWTNGRSKRITSIYKIDASR